MRTVVCSGAAILLAILATHAAAHERPDVTGCWAGDDIDGGGTGA